MLVILSAAAVLVYGVGALALVLLLAASTSRREWMLSIMLASVEALYLLGGSAHFLRIVMPGTGFPLLSKSGELAAVCGAISILYCSLIWSGLARRLTAAVVLGAAVGAFFQPWPMFAVCGGLSAAACARAAFIRRTAADGRLFLTLSCSLLLPALLFVLPKEPRFAALSYFGAVGVLYVATLRQNVFGLLISRRATLVVVLGSVTALYLLLIRFLADSLAYAFEAFSSVIETSLILAAAVLWMPLLAWTNRALGRRTALYTEFGQRVIEGAVFTLTVGDRAEFLASGIRRLLNVAAVHISVLGDHRLGRSSGSAHAPAEAELQTVSELLRTGSERFQHRLQVRDEAWIRVFAGIQYNYIVPLRYENRLTGILWVDSAPRQYLDDFEPVLLDIARQTSHSLESCRVMEDKIQLERSLMAQRQLAALGNVAASIAHEVKNPLSSIRALTQLMSEDEAFHARYGRDLGYIIGETDRLNASMRQLLTFARPPAETSEEVDLSALVASIVETVRKEKAGVPMEVRDRVSPGLVLRRASSEGLKQIVWNLLLNAMQAADGRGSVAVVAESAGRKEIRLSVSDDGPGIPPSIRERIFEPYFTTRQKGSGLGLSIVEKNVLALCGSLEVESPVASGRGARFTVILPEDRPETAA